jgi:hypothetical protein
MGFEYKYGELWSYKNGDKFFNKLSYDDQLDILKKYFPIGMEVIFGNDTQKCIYKGEIISYIKYKEMDKLYNISVKITETTSDIYPVGSIKTMHPGWYVGSESFIRNLKLKDILNEK